MIPEMDSQSEAWGSHSPLPWREDGSYIFDADGNFICAPGITSHRRLIVTAVNSHTSHAALLTAAKAVVADFRFHWPGTLLKAPLEDLEAAIVAAEENAP